MNKFIKILLTITAGCVSLTARAETYKCIIDTSRNGFIGSEVYMDEKSQVYVLLNYVDNRFDNTTEIFNARTCKNIGSGVTSKSNYASTLSKSGFKMVSVATTNNVVVPNSDYGYIAVSSSGDKINLFVESYDDFLVKNLKKFKKTIGIEILADSEMLDIMKNNPAIDKIGKVDIDMKYTAAAKGIELANAVFSIEDLLGKYKDTKIEGWLSGLYRSGLYELASRKVLNDEETENIFVDRAISFSRINDIERIKKWIAIFSKNTKIMNLALGRVISTENYEHAKLLRSQLNYLPTEISDGYKNLVFKKGSFSDLMNYAREGDDLALAKLFDMAGDEYEKKSAELLLLKKIAKSIFSINGKLISMRGPETSGSNVNIVGLGSNLRSSAKARLDADFIVNKSIYKPIYKYKVKVKYNIVFIGSSLRIGPFGGERRNDNAEEVSGVEINFYVTPDREKNSASVEFDWFPVSASNGIAGGHIFGGGSAFKARDVRVDLGEVLIDSAE